MTPTIAEIETLLAPAELISAELAPTGTRLTFRQDATSLGALTARARPLRVVVLEKGSEPGTYTLTIPASPRARTIAVRVPGALASHAAAQREATGATAAEQFWTAIHDHSDELEHRLVGRRRQLGLPAPARRRRRAEEPAKQLWMTMSPTELARLDELADRWTSGNRSALATAVFAAAQARSGGPT